MSGRWRGPVAAVAATGLLGGCGTVFERRDEVVAATTRFEQALESRRYAEVCTALAAVTRREVERSTGTRCEEGTGRQEVPEGGRIVRVDVHGRQARAVLARDTLFLSRFPDGWKILAAGCAERGDRPYRCEVRNG